MPFVVPRYHRDEVMYEAGAPYALVNWEYEIETEDFEKLGRINGFVPARSPVRIDPPPGPWEREHARHAGLFEVPVFSILVGVLRRLLDDATAELNLYALSSPASIAKVVKALQSPTAPQLIDCLAPGEMLIDLAVQVDLGYGDAIVIQTVGDLVDRRLPLLVREYEQAITAYEAEVAQIATIDEFKARMWRLLGLGDGRLTRGLTEARPV